MRFPAVNIRARETRRRLVVRGFTLIELLIVVAIIAILALIAVPNFLEAQVRAKVARTQNDLRALGVAVQAYCVDCTHWPFNPFYPDRDRLKIIRDRNWPMDYGIWYPLTTPVAYLTSLPRDPFKGPHNEHWLLWRDFYRVWNLEGHPTAHAESRRVLGHRDDVAGAGSTLHLARSGVDVLMLGVGPDRVSDIADGSAGSHMGGVGGLIFYDPTNGTVSWGDVHYGVPGGFDVFNKSLP